jgi:hypothetical protein
MADQGPRNIFIGSGDGIGANPNCPPPTNWSVRALPLEAVRRAAQGDGRTRTIILKVSDRTEVLIEICGDGKAYLETGTEVYPQGGYLYSESFRGRGEFGMIAIGHPFTMGYVGGPRSDYWKCIQGIRWEIEGLPTAPGTA